MVTEFDAFGDESGIEASAAYCIVGGYVGTPRQWKIFTKEWSAALDEYGVPRFHAKDFFQPARRRKVECYQGWTDQKLTRFLRLLLETLNRRRIEAAIAAVHAPSFNALAEDDRRFLSGGIMNTRAQLMGDDDLRLSRKWLSSGAPTRPYFCAFQGFISQALDKTSDDSILSFTLEQQNVVEARAIQTFHEAYKTERYLRSAKLGDITFADSERKLPLQAADLIAYLSNRRMNQSIRGSLLRQADEGIDRNKSRIRFYGREQLKAMLAQTSQEIVDNLASGLRAQLGEDSPEEPDG